jgi:hypothetical protein
MFSFAFPMQPFFSKILKLNKKMAKLPRQSNVKKIKQSILKL